MTEQQGLEKTKTYLSSELALESIERDPYWPKWDSPWWHMSLLNEMGLAKEIPQASILKMVQVLKNHYLPILVGSKQVGLVRENLNLERLLCFTSWVI